MEVEDIFNLPDYVEMKNKFIGKYKDDIIIKYEDKNIDTTSEDEFRRYVYILYKINDTYIGCAGTLTKSVLYEDSNIMDDLAKVYESTIEERIDKRIKGD